MRLWIRLGLTKAAQMELLITGSAGQRQGSGGQHHNQKGARFLMVSVVKRLDARWREDPHPTSAAPPPAQGA